MNEGRIEISYRLVYSVSTLDFKTIYNNIVRRFKNLIKIMMSSISLCLMHDICQCTIYLLYYYYKYFKIYQQTI